MQKYILFVIIVFLWLWINNTISSPSSIQVQAYNTLPEWSSSMLSYCAEQDKPCSFLPFQRSWANRLWIQTIQYVWADVYAQYHEQLHDRLDDITTLDNNRIYPYIFAQYLIPNVDDDILAAQQAVDIWTKWLQQICDIQAVQQVSQMTEQEFLDNYYNTTDKIVPCENYLLPQALAFVSFYYAKDIQQAISYYRVASLAYDAPDTLVNMPAIIVARYDNDRKSMMMRQQRQRAIEDQLNPELNDSDLFFLLSIREHTMRKAIHHTFLSVIQETAEQSSCEKDYSCVQENIVPILQWYVQSCDTDEIVIQTICHLIDQSYTQWRWNARGEIQYPLDPTIQYGRREDLEKWDVMPR